MYTFAEDLVLNSANLVLSSGNKVYSSNLLKTLLDKYSLLGDFGYTFRSFGLKDFIKDWKID